MELAEAESKGMGEVTEVMLHVYDVTNCVNGRANLAILKLNKILRDGIRLGGVFHGAVQVCYAKCLPPMFALRVQGRIGYSCLNNLRSRYTSSCHVKFQEPRLVLWCNVISAFDHTQKK